MTFSAGRAQHAAHFIHVHYGVEVSINRRGEIVMGESDLAYITAFMAKRIPGLVPIRSVMLVPIVTAPDWTMDPLLVAWARLLVYLVHRPGRRILRALIKRADR